MTGRRLRTAADERLLAGNAVARATLATFGLFSSLAIGCSSGSPVVTRGTDAGGPSEAGADGAQAPTYDGTTGKACTTDSQCVGTGGPGTNNCSNDFVATIAGVTGPAIPLAVCLPPPIADDCDPAPPSDPTGSLPHFCDGPDEPSSPGLCVADNPQQPQSGMGVCQPKCTFEINGSSASGCIAPDTCTASIFAEVQGAASTSVVGYGYCQGTCQTDSDCPPQMGVAATCQVDVGLCTTQPVARTLALGAACTSADYTSGACNCNFDSTTNAGFCTTACVVGGAPCPAGWVCDTGEPSVVNLGTANIPITSQTPGLAGTCLPACSVTSGVTASASVGVEGGVDAGGGDDAGNENDAEAVDSGSRADAGPDSGTIALACPGGSTCTPGTVAGPDCFP